MPSTTSLSWADHSTVLAGALSSLHSDTVDSDLLLLCSPRKSMMAGPQFGLRARFEVDNMQVGKLRH